jgi:tetratricopeptide (TPR) repeat protein
MLDNFIDLVDKYDKTLSHYSRNELVKLLIIRSQIQERIKENPEIGERVLELDKKLKQLNLEIPEDYRQLFNPDESHWWWFCKTEHKLDKLDWLWNDISLGVFAAAASVLIDTCSKFLLIGPDIISSLILGSHSILAVLAVQGSLTKKGHFILETLFKNIGLPRYLWKESQLVFSIICLGIVLLFHNYVLPALSEYYTNRGIIYYEQGQLFEANQRFNRAFKIDESNATAAYQLGLIQEFYDLESAMKYYKIALNSGYAPAYNNLGRIMLKTGELEAATGFLLQGLRKIEKKSYEGLEYYLLKNLGWVRLEQGRYQEAKTLLESAKQVGGDEKTGVASYCLLAIVKENLHQNPAKEWQICLAYASSINPDEDNWIQKARQFYENNEENNEENWWESLDNSFSDTYSE